MADSATQRLLISLREHTATLPTASHQESFRPNHPATGLRGSAKERESKNRTQIRAMIQYKKADLETPCA